MGSARKSVVLKTKSGHYFVGPDNGQLTLVAESLGIAEVREIDETKNRLKIQMSLTLFMAAMYMPTQGKACRRRYQF